ncbi:hypothetical protein PPERSA_00908 [Pseudocohnilembus persalinus]|uniref:Transmembrane protein n=1 Tax=Pseudocohnilembus persalinus TaxID=266149 RepID=A0A0V0QEM7_PSEPJ|nr:hypothetical protein PPERSA_00908 [Pseudocohnilembus persalinus]|eukprot:KRX00681.1 hypothetical protein PPERSA_00908 [Pseudocohnilembus persalinus]
MADILGKSNIQINKDLENKNQSTDLNEQQIQNEQINNQDIGDQDANKQNTQKETQVDKQNTFSKQQDNSIDQNNDKVESQEEDKNYLYMELAKKYNIPLDILEKNEQSTSFKSFQAKKQKEKESQERQLQTQEDISETQQMIIQQRLAKKKHISSYKKKYEIDSYLKGSFLDKQDEETPQVMRYMDEHRPFQIDMNIGKRAGDMIKSAATSQMKHEMAMQRGRGFLWHAAKTGKLGIDLWLCLYGFLGTFVIPYYFYHDQQKRMERWRNSKGINKDIDDFEEAGFDLDELSYDTTFENMYTKERKEQKEKRIEIHREIKFLVDYLMPNR